MLKSIYFIEATQLDNLIVALANDYTVFSPAIRDSKSKEPNYYQVRFNKDSHFVFNAYRVIEPLKSFFTHPLEKVAGYFAPAYKPTLNEKTVIFGIKACDLAGHRVQDYIFLEGPEVDQLYSLRRQNTILISGDCTGFKDVCHCLAWDILPHPTDGFDLNLSPLNDGYLVEVGSKKGEDLISGFSAYFHPAKDTQIAARRIKRQNLIEQLKKHLIPQGLVPRDSVQDLVRRGYDLETWNNFMLTCVECGGCNFICDTCHCFLLSDQRGDPEHSKSRSWDSCLYANYARVAGGANPLKTRIHRLRFRFTKKFDFFVDNLKMPACCGCGRCIEVCPGKIDIREVLKDLAAKLKQQKKDAANA